MNRNNFDGIHKFIPATSIGAKSNVVRNASKRRTIETISDCPATERDRLQPNIPKSEDYCPRNQIYPPWTGLPNDSLFDPEPEPEPEPEFDFDDNLDGGGVILYPEPEPEPEQSLNRNQSLSPSPSLSRK